MNTNIKNKNEEVKIYSSDFTELENNFSKFEHTAISIDINRIDDVKAIFELEEAKPISNIQDYNISIYLCLEKGLITKNEFEYYYNKFLESNKTMIINKIKELSEKYNKPIVIYSYGKPEDFCHRNIFMQKLIDWDMNIKGEVSLDKNLNQDTKFSILNISIYEEVKRVILNTTNGNLVFEVFDSVEEVNRVEKFVKENMHKTFKVYNGDKLFSNILATEDDSIEFSATRTFKNKENMK